MTGLRKYGVPANAGRRRNHRCISCDIPDISNVCSIRFSILILSALQPAAFENILPDHPYLMIGSVILSQFLLLLRMHCGPGKGEPLADPAHRYSHGNSPGALRPYPEESFYWYNGSVNYTFLYSLSLVLLTLYPGNCALETGKAKRVVLYRAGLPAGDSGGWQQFFHQRIHHVPVDLSAVILFLICRKDAFRRTWIVTLLETLSVLMCVTSPLTATRLNGNFGGSTANSPLMAIWLSLERTFLNIISWTNLKVLLLLVLLIPFFWKAVRKMNYEFRFPGLLLR